MNIDGTDITENKIDTDIVHSSDDGNSNESSEHHHHHHHHHHSSDDGSESSHHHHHSSDDGSESRHHHHHSSGSGKKSEGSSKHRSGISIEKFKKTGSKHHHSHHHHHLSKKKYSKSKKTNIITKIAKSIKRRGIKGTLKHYLSKLSSNKQNKTESEYKKTLKRIIFVTLVLAIFVLSYYAIITSSLEDEGIFRASTTPAEVDVLKNQVMQKDRQIKQLKEELQAYKDKYGELEIADEEKNQNGSKTDKAKETENKKGDSK